MSQSGGSSQNTVSQSASAGTTSANSLPVKSDKCRSDAGDQGKSKPPASLTQSPTQMDCGSDSPADSNAGGSSGSSESGRAHGPDSTSSPAPGRKITSDGSDLKDSIPHCSDLNGAPIVASAASSHIGGSGYNRNWNSGGFNRNRNMNRNNWVPGGRNAGPHPMHNNRPPHMAPISHGYGGPPGRRYPAGGPSQFSTYGFVPSGHLLPVGPDGAAAGLLPTPAAAVPAAYPPFGTPCLCSTCMSQYYYFNAAAAAAAQSMYAVAQPIPAGM